MLWDDQYLYVAVDVKDAELINANSKIDGVNAPFVDDSIEVYIDGDRIKGDYLNQLSKPIAQYVFRWNDATAYVYPGGTTATTTGVTHKTVATADGYVLEAAIPWSAVNGLTVAPDKIVGITVHVNDKDVNDPADTGEGILSFTANANDDWRTSASWAAFKLK